MKAWIVLFILAGVIAYVWVSTECVNTGYDINALKTRKVELMNANRMVQIEISSLKSAERIENIARNDLGLTVPDKYENISVMDGPDTGKGLFSGIASWFSNLFGGND